MFIERKETERNTKHTHKLAKKHFLSPFKLKKHNKILGVRWFVKYGTHTAN